MRQQKIFQAAALSAILSITGCVDAMNAGSSDTKAATGTLEEASTPTAQMVTFSDIPVPGGAEVDTDNSIILGGGDSWTGRVLLESSDVPAGVFEFYRQEMQGYGWEEVTAIRAATSVLTYAREDRIAIIQIGKSPAGSTSISVTMSPKGSGGADAKTN